MVSMAAALQQDPSAAAHTMPPARASLPPRGAAPRPKKQRVSFSSRTFVTYNKDSDDPFKLSSPQERQLSPLMDSSLISDSGQGASNAEEDTTNTIFPNIA